VYIKLAFNSITEIGIKSLRETLSVNKSLQSLNLSSNLLKDEGIIELSDVFKVPSNLIELVLSILMKAIVALKSRGLLQLRKFFK